MVFVLYIYKALKERRGESDGGRSKVSFKY